MEAARGRLPKVAPSGRAGVRALIGPIRWPERREAPIQKRLRSDLWAELQVALPDGTNTLCPTAGVSVPKVQPTIKHSSNFGHRTR